MTPYQDSVISIEFVVFLPYNETYVDETMWIGAAVEVGNSRIWAAEISVTVLNTTFSDSVSSADLRFVSVVICSYCFYLHYVGLLVLSNILSYSRACFPSTDLITVLQGGAKQSGTFHFIIFISLLCTVHAC